MKLLLVAIRDAKVGYMIPQAEQSEQTAIRNFGMLVNTGEGLMGYSPNDFDLYKVGEYDTDKGTIEACTPDLIVSAGLLKKE